MSARQSCQFDANERGENRVGCAAHVRDATLVNFSMPHVSPFTLSRLLISDLAWPRSQFGAHFHGKSWRRAFV